MKVSLQLVPCRSPSRPSRHSFLEPGAPLIRFREVHPRSQSEIRRCDQHGLCAWKASEADRERDNQVGLCSLFDAPMQGAYGKDSLALESERHLQLQV